MVLKVSRCFSLFLELVYQIFIPDYVGILTCCRVLRSLLISRFLVYDLRIMCLELINTILSVLGIVLGTFVAYHVYSLSQQKTFGERFARRESIQKQVEDLLYKTRNGTSSKVVLINIAKYDTHYPSKNDRNKHGYTYLSAELKSYYFGGVEFFCEVITGYMLKGDNFSKKATTVGQEPVNIFVSGVIPYEWVESIDLRGDDTSYRPQFYVHFKGKNKSPYKNFYYYIKDAAGFTELKLVG